MRTKKRLRALHEAVAVLQRQIADLHADVLKAVQNPPVGPYVSPVRDSHGRFKKRNTR